jgi:hypothetical protein
MVDWKQREKKKSGSGVTFKVMLPVTHFLQLSLIFWSFCHLPK